MAAGVDIDEVIAALDAVLRRVAPEFYASLGPGLSEAELDQLERDLGGVTLPEDFRRLYAWKNGPTAYVDWYPWEGDLMVAPDQIRSLWSPYPGMRQPDEPPADTDEERAADLLYWDPAWVPFLDILNDMMCVDTRGSFGGQPGQVVYWQHDSESTCTIEFSRLAHWIALSVARLSDPSLLTHDGIDFEKCPWRIIQESLDPGYPLTVQSNGEVINSHGERVWLQREQG